MGRADRIRKAMLEAGHKELTFRNGVQGIGDRAVAKISGMTEKVLTKTFGSMTLVQQTRQAKGMLRMVGTTKFLKGFLPGFKDDLVERRKELQKEADKKDGHKVENKEVMAMYFECPEFMEFWRVSLGMGDKELMEMLDPIKDGEGGEKGGGESLP